MPWQGVFKHSKTHSEGVWHEENTYSFTVIRYVHDRAAGESLNVGVILFAPEAAYIGLEVEQRFERLSRTFSIRAESLQDKATRWLGNATALKGHPKLGKLYLLLGEPRLDSHRPAYEKAKNLLHKMDIKHEIIEERDAESFADDLASYMRKHGIGTGDRG